MKNLSIHEFIDELFSKSPVPGGGAASALVGAISVSLAGMVAGISHGKKGYEDFEEDLERIITRANAAKEKLLDLMEKDAEAYLKVSEVYKEKAVTEAEKKEKRERLEDSLLGAARPPFLMLELLLEVREIFDELETKGTPLALSDVGIGGMFLHAAMKGAAMNVLVNTKLMKNEAVARELEERVRNMLSADEGRTRQLYADMDVLF